MDECDRGNIAADKYLTGAIAARRAKANQRGQIAQFCKDCGEQIEPARRENAIKAGNPCERCVRCQTKSERA